MFVILSCLFIASFVDHLCYFFPFFYAFMRVCLLMHCGHLLGKVDLLALVCDVLSLSHWYPGSDVMLDCIDSGSLPSFLL